MPIHFLDLATGRMVEASRCEIRNGKLVPGGFVRHLPDLGPVRPCPECGTESTGEFPPDDDGSGWMCPHCGRV